MIVEGREISSRSKVLPPTAARVEPGLGSLLSVGVSSRGDSRGSSALRTTPGIEMAEGTNRTQIRSTTA
jgi:hypothetical protein